MLTTLRTRAPRELSCSGGTPLVVFLKTHMRCNRNPSVILQANKAAAVASLT